MNKKFTFEENTHTYRLDGKRMYGVTTVLGIIAKPALISWSAKMAVEYIKERTDKFIHHIDGAEYNVSEDIYKEVLNEAKTAYAKKRDKAGEQGTDVHAEVEKMIKRAIDNDNGHIIREYIIKSHHIKQVEHFVNWAVENKIKFLASEQMLWSESMFCAGTVDFVFEKDGKRYIGDIKTGRQIYDEAYFQMGGYQIMLEEMGKNNFAGSVVVRLGKDGKFEEKWNYDMETNKRAFLSALELFKIKEQLKK